MSEQKVKKDKGSKRYVYLVILVASFIAAYVYTFDSKLAMLGDNASYYILGKALSQGEGYVSINSISHRPNNHYPPGYPAIISTILLFTKAITPIKILNGIFFILGLWLFFDLINKVTDNEAFAFTATFMALLNSHMLWYSSIMMSEIPFFFFSTLSLWAFVNIDQEKWLWKDPYLILCIITMIISYYIRSLGIALLGGYILYFIFQKKWKPILGFFIAFVVGALPWFIRSQKLGGGSYMKQLGMINPYQPALGKADFGDFVDRFFSNFSRYITFEIPSAIFPLKEPEYGSSYSAEDWLLGVVIVGLFFYGVFSLPKYRWLILGYTLGTLAILMIWPDVWIGVRFIVPLIPLFTLGFLYGLYDGILKLRGLLSFKKPVSPYLLLAFSLLYIKPVNAIHDQARVPYMPGWRNYFEIAKWVDRNLEEGVVVSCGKPSLFYLYADTYTRRYKFAQDPKELIADLEKHAVDYVVIDQVYGNTIRYLLPAVRQYPERFEQVYHLKNPDTFLLKFKR
ncbi:hypothetical protein JMN32_13920 [Fulvivirga sp. 29W222]|uniref:Glycosyltransferase RgtA/B/C/D-like domain-containing protein n=1 Tax=Fulvivirga marina TaxID=2494733 RepID=A0A937KEQ2_9BACT|nr:hypothetical protein [Fulvivirga marina]MBL6447410.1 hypothetical protein [Fulvivirga marina]